MVKKVFIIGSTPSRLCESSSVNCVMVVKRSFSFWTRLEN